MLGSQYTWSGIAQKYLNCPQRGNSGDSGKNKQIAEKLQVQEILNNMEKRKFLKLNYSKEEKIGNL